MQPTEPGFNNVFDYPIKPLFYKHWEIEGLLSDTEGKITAPVKIQLLASRAGLIGLQVMLDIMFSYLCS